MKTYSANESRFYIEEPYVKKNVFIGAEAEQAPLPEYERISNELPDIVWEGYEDAVACYRKAWEVAFHNLKKPMENSGFITNFIDAAFNGAIFMWDLSFIMMFGKYATNVFDFQKSLDNFYAKQHKDGFICREIREVDGGDYFTRFDPISTGPDIMGWSEWEYYRFTGDAERLKKVFDPLMAYHKWMKENRTWRDMSYWSSGWGCGMDNMPRLMPKYHTEFSHGHMVWLDTCFQAVFSAQNLIRIAQVIGRDSETKELRQEIEYLNSYINTHLWDEKSGYYYDLWENGEFNYVKSIGAYWGMLSESMPKERLKKMVSYLDDKNMFCRTHRVTSLSADDKYYVSPGGYWRGPVWAPTNYMVLAGLRENHFDKMAYEIALNNVENVVESFRKTGTFWENYEAERFGENSSDRGDFVGWTGLVPLAILPEFVFGIQKDMRKKKIVWRVNRMERHGVLQYPVEDGKSISLICEAREYKEQKPAITVLGETALQIEICWGEKSYTIAAGENSYDNNQ